ncbi:MAG: zinc transporter [Fimbriimonadales bacterium]|nr:MAG: zinc transporter [Fimbriimonadales bacterium]CUU33841.1 zinc transport system permease protein [Armatimonadetes bacterium GXS]
MDWFQFDFVRYALMAMALLTAFYPFLGVFVVGQRVAYFGDAVAHSAFLGAALAVVLGWQLGDALLITAPLFALLIAWFQSRTALPPDTLLVVAITGVSALGIMLVSLTEAPLALQALLFGDVLGIEPADLWRLFGVDCLGWAMLLGLARPLIRIGFHRELAQAQGVPVRLVETLFLVGLSLAVAVGVRAVGILPISALLVLPAASARALSQSFRQMMALSGLLGGISLVGGFGLALWQPIPPGAAVALIASALFLAVVLFKPHAKGIIR